MSWNCYYPKGLRLIGLTEHTTDFSDVATQEDFRKRAYCNSTKCARPNSIALVEKFVLDELDDCPDCGSALIWKVKKKSFQQENRSAKKGKHLSSDSKRQGCNVSL